MAPRRSALVALLLCACTGSNPDFRPECATLPQPAWCAESYDGPMPDLQGWRAPDMSVRDLYEKPSDFRLLPGCGGEYQGCCTDLGTNPNDVPGYCNDPCDRDPCATLCGQPGCNGVRWQCAIGGEDNIPICQRR